MLKGRRKFEEDKDYYCMCGCGNLVEVKYFHRNHGVPRYCIGHANKGRPSYERTAMHKKVMSTIKLEDNPWKGQKHTDEWKKQKSIETSGENNPMYGKNHTDEAKDSIGSKNKGNVGWSKGRTSVFSESALKRMSDAKLGNKHCVGNRHSAKTRGKQSASAIERLLRNGGIHTSWKHCKTGYFYSNKNNTEIYYASSNEEMAFIILEELKDVKSYKRCADRIPIIFEDIEKNYLPDIHVEYINGKIEILEVKPANLLKELLNITKFKAAIKYYKERGIKYSVWTEKKLFKSISYNTWKSQKTI